MLSISPRFLPGLRTGVLLSSLFAIALLSGCSGGTAASNDDAATSAQQRWNLPELRFTEDGLPHPDILAERQVLHRGNGSQPQGLDPHLTEGVPDANVQRDLFEGLVSAGPDVALEPGVAERWEISEDGTRYVFHLRHDAKWSNGEPMTSADWVYSFRRVLDPQTGSKYAMILSPIVNARQVMGGELPPEQIGVTALDDYTLEIRLNAPAPYFLELLTHNSAYPVHRASVERHGDAHARAGNLVSNGAYRLEELVMQSHIRLVRNPHYYDNARTIIDEVYFYPIEDQAAELKRYRANELDMTYEVPNAQFDWISANLGDELTVSTYFGTYYFGFNTSRAPFDDIRVRQALALTIDRDIITDKLTRFGEVPAYSFTPPGVPGFDYASVQPEWAGWSQQQRNEYARELLAQAGFDEANPLALEIRYNTHQNHKKIALGIAAMWKQALGVRATLINEEFRVFLANRRQRSLTQVVRIGWIGDYLDPTNFLDLYHSQNAQNDVAYEEPRYDALLAQAAVTADPAQRMRVLEEAERTLLGDYPIAPIYTYVSKRVVKPYVRGWQPNASDHHRSRHMYILKH
ncbi:MAG: peptide ABC transporter substrate-binding protein [Lysobacteraceae bacterium]